MPEAPVKLTAEERVPISITAKVKKPPGNIMLETVPIYVPCMLYMYIVCYSVAFLCVLFWFNSHTALDLVLTMLEYCS